jgi:hypothetical protein
VASRTCPFCGRLGVSGEASCSGPFISHSIDDLEDALERAESTGDLAIPNLIAHELGFRKTSRARELSEAVAEVLATRPHIHGTSAGANTCFLMVMGR